MALFALYGEARGCALGCYQGIIIVRYLFLHVPSCAVWLLCWRLLSRPHA